MPPFSSILSKLNPTMSLVEVFVYVVAGLGAILVAYAVFLKKEEKLPYVRIAIRKLDTLKILLMVLWETKALDNKKYIALSEKFSSLGRMLGGWNGQLAKENSPKAGEK
mgnify:CR=1 FL=1